MIITIKVENLTKKFVRTEKNKTKKEFIADNNLSFEVKDGEILGILGPNGAGKTTLLRMLSGIMKPNEGNITIDGEEYIDSAINIKKKIAFLSGNTKIYNTFSCYELLKMCAEMYDVKKDTVEDRIQEISKILKMENFLYNRIDKLSTGQMQRVNIARCLIHNPKYYILDEATSGLDIITSQVILDFIKSEKKNGKTIIYSTHYMEEAENICDRIIMIDKGNIIKTGSPDKILKDTKTTNLRDAFMSLIGGSNE